ncbi:V-type proton ATPase subunit F [Elysia marginata]|uniref:V-type proton ATPase subunit F n=1 Tax=Elysia marginata TaxID=1093978 RepID=A0AAV4GKV5_9GAST|nr:V-type proton ATPase subunit F [Elysia marginata]
MAIAAARGKLIAVIGDEIQRHFRLGYSSLILVNHFRFRLSSHYFQKRGVELRSLDEESVQLLRLRNCSDEQVPGQDTCIGFVLGGVGEMNKNRHPNFMVVDKNSSVGEIEETFRGFLRRDDIGIILINQNGMFSAEDFR